MEQCSLFLYIYTYMYTYILYNIYIITIVIIYIVWYIYFFKRNSFPIIPKNTFRIKTIPFQGYYAFISNIQFQFIIVVARFSGVQENFASSYFTVFFCLHLWVEVLYLFSEEKSIHSIRWNDLFCVMQILIITPVVLITVTMGFIEFSEMNTEISVEVIMFLIFFMLWENLCE